MSIPDPPRDPIDRARASSFGPAASAFAEHRPDYPGDAVDAALPGSPRRVLDVGAGTGKLTAALVARGLDVVAVEPDERMLAVLRADLPGVDARIGRAESIPLPDADADAIVVGQAMHWFEAEPATDEAARVLRRGGSLAGLWNTWDASVEWVREVRDIVRDGQEPVPTPGRPGFREPIEDDPRFTDGELVEYRWLRRMTVDAVLGEFGTHSLLLTRPPERRDPVLGRVRDYLEGRPETASGEFSVPMLTHVWRTLRR